jgi:hypothetical protein
MYTAISIVTGTLYGQVMLWIGRPHAVASGWERVITGVIVGAVALATPMVAGSVIQVAARVMRP